MNSWHSRIMRERMMRRKRVRRVLIGFPVAKFRCSIDPIKQINNRFSKDFNLDYELVVQFRYGLDEEAIARIAGLRNYDTGISLTGSEAGIRDLMFPCGTNRELAFLAANRLYTADH